MNDMQNALAIPILVGWFTGWLVNRLAHTPSSLQPAGAGSGWPLQLCLTGASLYTWLMPVPPLPYLHTMFLLLYFGIVALVDINHRHIPHRISLPGALLGLFTGIQRYGILHALGGGLLGFLIMFIIYQFGQLYGKYRRRRLLAMGRPHDEEPALGFGDVILSGILGLILGTAQMPACILLGLLIAACLAGLMTIRQFIRRSRRANAFSVFLPLGACLIASAAILLYFPLF